MLAKTIEHINIVLSS